MADSFTKKYSVTVTFTKDDFPSRALTSSDIQATELRNEIIAGIGKACWKSKGVYSAQPGTVSET